MEEVGVGRGWCWNVKMLFNYRVDELSFKNTVNSLESDPPWCTTKWLLKGGGRLPEKSRKLTFFQANLAWSNRQLAVKFHTE